MRAETARVYGFDRCARAAELFGYVGSSGGVIAGKPGQESGTHLGVFERFDRFAGLLGPLLGDGHCPWGWGR